MSLLYVVTFVARCSCPVQDSVPYSVQAGSSDGRPGNGGVSPINCFPCPFGGSCDDGRIVAVDGFWGGGYPKIVFTVCPNGYCCSSTTDDGDVSWPCSAVNSCGNYRTGMLCGDCMNGTVESIGSALCVPLANCDSDLALFWPLLVLGLFLSAVLQLVFVSDVWTVNVGGSTGCRRLTRSQSVLSRENSDPSESEGGASIPTRRLPSAALSLVSPQDRGVGGGGGGKGNNPLRPRGKMKLAIYYFQLTQFVQFGVTRSQTSAMEQLAAAFLRQQLPSRSPLESAYSFCAFRSLTALSKVEFEATLPVLVGAAMLTVGGVARAMREVRSRGCRGAVVACLRWLTACCCRRGRRRRSHRSGDKAATRGRDDAPGRSRLAVSVNATTAGRNDDGVESLKAALLAADPVQRCSRVHGGFSGILLLFLLLRKDMVVG